MDKVLRSAQIVQKLWIDFYGRGVDAAGLNFWADSLGDGTDTKDVMHKKPAFSLKWGFLLSKF
jgi:hypothetical protein